MSQESESQWYNTSLNVLSSVTSRSITVLELITANDVALVQVWSECDRNLQSTVWKMLTIAQKATAKELLDSVRTKVEK